MREYQMSTLSRRPIGTSVMRSSGLRTLIAVTAVLIAGCGVSPESRPTPAEPTSKVDAGTTAPSLQPSPIDAFAKVHGWIAYRDGQDIVAVDPEDPTARVVLGDSAGLDPIGWSQDGTRLLLLSGGTEYQGLYVSNADGSVVTLVPGRWSRSGHGTFATWGSFSPDNTRVVYGVTGHFPGPFVVDVDGSRPKSLLGPCEPPAFAVTGPGGVSCGERFKEAAAWSPDGSVIAWADFVEDSRVYGRHARMLSFVEPDGTGLRTEVASLPGDGLSLVWSPNGSQLAFWGTRDPEDDDFPAQIFVINADGSGLTQLTHEGDNRWPSWSPDGSRIAFERDGLLYTMASDGTDVREIAGVRPDGAFAWNPVG